MLYKIFVNKISICVFLYLVDQLDHPMWYVQPVPEIVSKTLDEIYGL